ncbi:MAG TPA: outer membrane beta-barrel protein [Paludibacteraceae bacterium]|nr:outer membrane beta-barrel protein [Paludibacteraceae bacterium]
MMLNKIFQRTFLAFFLLITVSASAQKNREQYTYYMEAGLQGGGAFYLGDVNPTLFNNLGPSFGAFGKYKFDGHHELGLDVTGGWVGIQAINDVMQTVDFVDMSVLYTFNFWNYGAKKYQENASNFTPYLFFGLGATVYNFQAGLFGMNVPFGFGVKYKFAGRWNVGASWTMHKLLVDNFDNVNDPYRLNKGVFNNKDWFSTFGIFLSFDFLEICAPCRNHSMNRRKK